MEVIDSQPLVGQDLLTADSQSLIETNVSTLSESVVSDNIESTQFDLADSAASISQQQTDTEANFAQTSTFSASSVEISGTQSSKVAQQSDALTGASYSTKISQSFLKNSGFDQPINGTNWLVGKTGKVKDYDSKVSSVAYTYNVAGQGKQMYLKLPKEANINYQDQLSIFQDVSNLKTDKVYAVEARVKWLNPQNKLPSAIVSFWAKNPDNSYRGQDFKITDGNGYKKLRFEFTPSKQGTTRFFLGLFTHINGNIDDTEICVDDYKVTEISSIPKGNDSRQGNLLRDGGFDKYNAQPKFNQAGWTYTIESPVSGLKQSLPMLNGNKKLRLEMPKAWKSNDQFNQSVTGVYQSVNLVGGHTYQLSADFQRKEFQQFSSQKDSIAQLIMYRKKASGEDLFLGPIDVPLTNNNLLTKKFTVLAPESGNYTVLVRLAGWGNEGNGIVVDVDNVRLLA